MKRKKKSALKRMATHLFLLSFFLGGCADTKWPGWLTGEPDEDVLNAPRALTRLSSEEKRGWPSLGDVPSEKPKFSAPLDLAKKAEDLKKENIKAQAEKRRLQNIAEPESMNTQAIKQPALSAKEALLPFFALKPEGN